MCEKFWYKDAYMNRLTNCLNDTLLQCFDESIGKEKLVVTECNQTQDNVKHNYQLMVPVTLFKKWLSLVSGESNVNEKIKDGLEKLKEFSTSWKIRLCRIDMTYSTIMFGIDKKSLADTLMKHYCSDASVNEVKNLCLLSDSSRKIVVICYLNDTSAARTLLLTSLMFEKCCTYLQISKQGLRVDIPSLLHTLNFDFHFTNTTFDAGTIIDIFAKSQYFQYENEILFFEKSCVEQFVKSQSSYKCVLKTKLQLNSSILNWIYDMENTLLTLEAENSLTNAKVYHIGTQDSALLAKQLSLCFLVYLDQCNKRLLSAARRLLLDKTEIFHGPIKTTWTAVEVLGSYRRSLSDSFALKYGKSASWTSLVDALAPSVLKLDLLSASLSSSISEEFCNGTNSSANFVMYNYCRLSTLLDNYTEKVETGYYPFLPKIEDVDFSLLQEENELRLLHHIWKFGDIQVPRSNNPHHQMLKPHLIVAYIKQLCRIFSTFYNRYHVLGSNLTHLLPLMHARIYLVKAVQHILKQVFALFKIVPLEHM